MLAPQAALLNISIVSYDTPLSVLLRTIKSALHSLQQLRGSYPSGQFSLTLVENSESRNLSQGDFSPIWQQLKRAKCKFGLIQGHGNIGYGRGQNLAFDVRPARYHLFMNPDVEMEIDCLSLGIAYLERNGDVAMISPLAVDAIGEKQFLCKQYPAVFDLFIRGFMPNPLRRMLANRLSRYEMRHLSELEPSKDVSIVSGCFMLCRSEVIAKISGFDPAYFLYFEDFDLSIRVGHIASIAYVPSMRIRHYGGQAARKGIKHVLFFCQSGIRFFRSYGWRWF